MRGDNELSRDDLDPKSVEVCTTIAIDLCKHLIVESWMAKVLDSELKKDKGPITDKAVEAGTKVMLRQGDILTSSLRFGKMAVNRYRDSKKMEEKEVGMSCPVDLSPGNSDKS